MMPGVVNNTLALTIQTSESGISFHRAMSQGTRCAINRHNRDY